METKSYKYDEGKLNLIVFFFLIFMVIFGCFAYFSDQDFGFRLFMGLISVGSVAAIVFAMRILMTNSPYFTLTVEGVQAPLIFSDTIPWSQVTGITQYVFNKAVILKLTIGESFLKTVKWVGPFSWIGIKPKALKINVSNLDGVAEDILKSTALAWQNGRQAAMAAHEPIAPPTHETFSRILAQKEPIATYCIIGLISIVYLLELVFERNGIKAFSPSTTTLAYLGGDIGNRVRNVGEFWRMFTAPLMHAGPGHIFMNSLVLWWAGGTLEKIAGWKWLLGTFALSAIGGEIASNLFLAPNVVGVGASGGVMGLLAGLLVAAGRMPESYNVILRTNAARFLIPSLFPLLASKGNVNGYAHAGGAIVGLVLGFILLKLWPRDAAHPPFANAMAIAAFGFFAVAAYAIYPIMKLYGH